MPPLFDRLLGRSSHNIGSTQTVRKIVRELDELPPREARYLAAFAYLLGRVANADRFIAPEETSKMVQLLTARSNLPTSRVQLVVEMATQQNTLFGRTEDSEVTREFCEISTPEQRQELMHCLFAMSAADDTVSSVEEKEIQAIANALGFSTRDYLGLLSHYQDKREPRAVS